MASSPLRNEVVLSSDQVQTNETKQLSTTSTTTTITNPINAPTSPMIIEKKSPSVPTARDKLRNLSTETTLRDITTQTSSVSSTLYISEIRTDGFAIIVTECHHVLELPIALLPSGGKKGDTLDFNLTISKEASQQAQNTMSTIQDVLKSSAM
jgi:hypothetical protein